MRKVLLTFILIYSVNASAQTIAQTDTNLKKTVFTKKTPKSIFSNTIFVKGSVGTTSAEVNEWESTINIASSNGGGGLGGGSWFGGGASSTQQSTYNSVKRQFTTISCKAGNKWLFGSGEKWKPGVQLTWFKYTAFIPVSDGDFKRSISFAMLGFNNTFKLSENSAIEFNGDYGISFTKNNLKGEVNPRSKGIGLSYDFELNYRYKRLTAGLDFSSIHRGAQLSNDWSSLNTFSLSVGAIF